MSQLDDFVRETQARLIAEARAQYSDTVVAHWLEPRNLGPMDRPDGHARVTGPCGDTLEVFLRVREGNVTDASFLTDGCIASIASGSAAVTLALGRSLRELKTVSREDILEALGGLPRESEHCAALAANTLRGAIDACEPPQGGQDRPRSDADP
jgi:nitrogen fixation NifU-like protein